MLASMRRNYIGSTDIIRQWDKNGNGEPQTRGTMMAFATLWFMPVPPRNYVDASRIPGGVSQVSWKSGRCWPTCRASSRHTSRCMARAEIDPHTRTTALGY